MSQPSDTQPLSAAATLQIFQSGLQTVSPSSQRAYRAAVASLRSYLTTAISADELLVAPFTSTTLSDWAVAALHSGLTLKSTIHYLDCLASLYNSGVAAPRASQPASQPAQQRCGSPCGGTCAPEIAFPAIKAQLKAFDAAPGPEVTAAHFDRLLALVKQADQLPSPDERTLADLIIYSLLNQGLPLAEAAELRRDDCGRLSAECSSIAERNLDPKRRYVFALNQSRYTPAQMRRYLAVQCGLLLERFRVPLIAGSVEETLRSFWAYAALRAKLPASLVLSLLAGSEPKALKLNWLPADHPQETIAAAIDAPALIELVGEQISSNPRRWYAMRLRPGIKYAELSSRIDALPREVRRPELFYPCDAIARRIGKRLVYEERPLIADVAFFKTRVTDITRLFSHIGSMAWCYRTSPDRPDSYAPIPTDDMLRFQTAIGQFTPDYEIAPIGTLPLRPGDRVVVIGGEYESLTGTILDIDGSGSESEGGAPGATLYRVAFLGANGIEWRVNIDPRLVAPV